MTETQRKIREYQQMLPGLKERVMAVAVLLVVSLTMVVSASFAWITLSRAPEVSMITTTVAANGNLEIALVDDEGNVPQEVAVGDSAAAPGKNLVTANITWGNLVNLSDSSYGLNHISLRPALLSGYNLDKTPLYGATYSEDGRVKDVSATYQYASWAEAEDGTTYFAAGDAATYGVRAISTVKYENITGNATLTTMINRAKTAYMAANTKYLNLINGDTMVDEARGVSCMDALTALLEIFVNEKAESATISGGDAYYDYQSVVTYTYRLMVEFRNILDAEGEAMLLLANLQAYANNAELGTNYFESAAELRAASKSELNKLGISLKSLDTYKSNYTNLEKSIIGLEPLAIAYDPDTGTATDKVYWSDSPIENGVTLQVNGIGKYVVSLVDINSTTCNDIPINKVSISNAFDVVKEPIRVVMNQGVIKDTEQRLGDMLYTQGTTVTINITVMSLGRKTANVRTSAAAPFYCNVDLGSCASMEATGGGEAVGLDTYGMAIDLWLRTNQQDAILTLEGNIDDAEEPAFGKDFNGNEVELYVATNADGSRDVYMLPGTDQEGNPATVVYDYVSHTPMGTQTELISEEGGKYSFSRKMNTIVVGYHGENRVWEDWEQMLEQGLIDENSTTQGAGSCYVFYANPSDQDRILEMLKAFTIAFIDQDGVNVATARLDTEHHYAINGKVTVPMSIISGVSYIDEDGNDRIGIQVMPRNEPTWLTAVIYLDGMTLTNEHVLAAGEIEGRLNIQFGTADEKTALDDLELQQKYRTVSATAASGDQVSTKADEPISFKFDGNAKAVTVTLTVDGDQPSNVSAFFIRSIGSSQGTRTEAEDFKLQANGTWQATFDITRPGSYTLRTVHLDGVEYVLDETPAVEIEGRSVAFVRSNPGSGKIMTADNFVDVEVEAKINADASLMPSQVRALFRSDKKEYSAALSYDAVNETWTGLARINSSGVYTLEYLVMDGDYTELAKTDDPNTNQQTTLDITLGMKAAVSLTGIVDADGNPVTSTVFKFENGPYSIGVGVELFDDANNPLPKQDNVILYYGLEGSDVDSDGMYVAVVYDSASGKYKGHLKMENAGTYRFNRVKVTIGQTVSNIRYAPGAPVFESSPPEPPRMDMVLSRNATAKYQFTPGGDAQMSFNMYYAQSADVYAVIENLYNGQQKLVKASSKKMLTNPDDSTDTNYYRFYFDVPDTDRGHTYDGAVFQEVQDGEWAIKEIWLQKVWDENGVAYPAVVDETTGLPAGADCLVFDVYNENKTPEENAYTYVVQTIRPVYSYTYVPADGTVSATYDSAGKKIIFGKDASGKVTGDFMDSYSSVLTLTLADWKGQAIRGLADVQWTIQHQAQNQATMGGYSGGTYGTNTVALSGSGTTYTSAAQTFQLAGTYATEISFTVTSTVTDPDSGETKTSVFTYDTKDYPGNTPADYELWSIVPTVAISGISSNNPVGQTVTVDKGSDANSTHGTSDKIPQWTATEATVYFVCSRSGSGGTCDPYRHNYSRPSVSITLQGIGNATKANLDFGTSVHVYNGTTQVTGYEWTANGAVSRNIGYFKSNTASTDSKTPAGDLSANQLKLTYNGVTYTFTVPTITIHNPY